MQTQNTAQSAQSVTQESDIRNNDNTSIATEYAPICPTIVEEVEEETKD